MKISPITPNLHNTNRDEILNYFEDSYSKYEDLFTILKSDESFYEQPEKLRHPLVFYFGHTAVFFINKLILAGLIDTRVNAEFEALFAIGVDEMSWDDLNQSNYSWPKIDEIRQYRNEVREIVKNLIKTLPLNLPIDWDNPFWIILMGIEHERIHLETSSVLIRQLDINHIKPKFRECEEYSLIYPQNELIKVSGATFKLSKDDKYYGWDNEYGEHTAIVYDFFASKYLVSNGEFLEFVNDNCYNKLEFWSEEGKRWLNYTLAKHPTFWIKDGENYKLRTIQKIIDLPLNFPAEVNFLEAEAFCNYKSKKDGKNYRLPSEDEYYRLYDVSTIKDANINLNFFSPTPVDKFSFGDFYDVVGNVWQWSCTPIYPFNGFKVHKIYDDFTTPTFDTKHNLIKGGSFISTGNEVIKESRYAFRRHFFQHAGFRYVVGEDIKHFDTEFNELSELIEEDFNFDYSKLYNLISNLNIKSKALDIGCKSGNFTFQLSNIFDSVVGIDFSARVIRLGLELKQNNRLKYSNGEVILGNCNRDRVDFFQADASNLKPIFKNYDLIICRNFETLYNKSKFLKELDLRLNDGGYFVLFSKEKVELNMRLIFDDNLVQIWQK